MAKEILVLGLIALPLVWPFPARADGQNRAEWANPPRETVSKNSAATFDQRLPPVLPGETLNTRGGKMKVWSSSGPVPALSPPEAPQAPAQNLQTDLSGLGVVIDGRRPLAPPPKHGRYSGHQ